MNYKIVIASTNKGKIKEINKILNNIENFQIDVMFLEHGIPEPNEPYNTFMENAVHKAKYYAKHTKHPTLSEDSGLCIEALNGFPGVKSKDLVHECNGILNTFIKIEKMLSGTNNYRAYCNTAMAIYIPSNDLLITHEAKAHGIICFPPRVNQNSVTTEEFGIDPIFIPEGYDKTFAELGIEIKNKISQRNKAINGVIKKLQKFLNTNIPNTTKA